MALVIRFTPNPYHLQLTEDIRHAVGFLYKYYVIKVAKNGAKSFGDRSNLVRVVTSCLYEEAAMVVEALDPRSTLALMELEVMGEACEELELKLYSWAII